LSDKADVYSFGVLLLETISGKKNQDPTQSEVEVYLPKRVCDHFHCFLDFDVIFIM
jgi:hypothetical protein